MTSNRARLCVIREIDRKARGSHDTTTPSRTILERAQRLRSQSMKCEDKVYALRAPEVECIGKCRARKPYEFAVRAGIAIATSRSASTEYSGRG